MITSSPLTAITLTRWLAARLRTHAWRNSLGKKQAARAAWAARCICSTGEITCTVVTPLSALTFLWRLEWLLPSSTGAKIVSRSASSVTAQLIKDPSVKRSTSLKQIVDRAEGYDIPGEIVDGMNFREVRDKIAEIVDSIRKEPHPAFLEVRTYRYRGHSMSDPASYRTKQELEKYR